MTEENGNVSNIEIAQADKADTDYLPTEGKPIIKLIWHENTKQWNVAFDQRVFPSKMFLASAIRSIAEDLEKQIDMEREFIFSQNIQRQMAEQQATQQLAQQLRRN